MHPTPTDIHPTTCPTCGRCPTCGHTPGRNDYPQHYEWQPYEWQAPHMTLTGPIQNVNDETTRAAG